MRDEEDFKTVRAVKRWGVWGINFGKRGWSPLRKERMAANPASLIIERMTSMAYDAAITWAPFDDDLAATVCMLPDRPTQTSAYSTSGPQAASLMPGQILRAPALKINTSDIARSKLDYRNELDALLDRHLNPPVEDPNS